jgi:hypothetical protein
MRPIRAELWWRAVRQFTPALTQVASHDVQASPVPGEGNEQQALYWQVSDDWGLTWSAPRAPLQPVNSSSGRHLPMWSPVTHTRVRGVMRESWSSYYRC